jgi:hypothetical protein
MVSVTEHCLTIPVETITYVSEEWNFLETNYDNILSAVVRQWSVITINWKHPETSQALPVSVSLWPIRFANSGHLDFALGQIQHSLLKILVDFEIRLNWTVSSLTRSLKHGALRRCLYCILFLDVSSCFSFNGLPWRPILLALPYFQLSSYSL